MSRRRTNKIGFVVLGVFVAVFLFAFLAQKFKNSIEVEAANMAAFDPGYIISDYQMGNYNSMNEGQIQSFLSSKGRCGNTNFSGVGTRVGHFSDSTPPTTWHVVNGHTVCLAEENMNGESAAHIIWQAAQDYRINPQVLIVLLQKETGLITDPIPNSWDYQRATGYGCPDTAACSSKYYGFKNQIRNAASLFRYTLDNGYSRYPVGNVYVQWNPNAGCGGSVVNIRNNATSALYRYTPYQPNAAALASSYGSGDGCSAYGNRNFYSYFEDWFGGIKSEVKPAVEAETNYEHTVKDGKYQLVSKANGKAADIYGGVTKGMTSGQVTMFNKKNENAKNQVFEIKYDESNGYYSIINPTTNLSFDVKGASTDISTPIIVWPQHNNCNQDWLFEKDDKGFYTIISRCSSRVLDATASNSLIIFDRHNGDNQKWQLVEYNEASEPATLETGVDYQIINTSGKALDIYGGVHAGMTKGEVVAFDKKTSGLANQTVRLENDTASGEYFIVNPATGLYLDVSGASSEDNTGVIFFTHNGNCNQRWKLKKEDGKYKISSVCSSKILSLSTSTKLGASYRLVINSEDKTDTGFWDFLKL